MDLTSLENIKNYGDASASKDDAIISGLIPALSAAVESYCNQSFGTVSVNQVGTFHSYHALIDADGILTFYPPHNHITAVTALQYRQRGNLAWQSLNPANLDIANHDCGPVVRLYNADFSSYRAGGARIQVQTALTAGYNDLKTLPANLEYAVRRLVWWAYKQRSAPMEKTAIPEMGVLIIPSAWPADALAMLETYIRYFS